MYKTYQGISCVIFIQLTNCFEFGLYIVVLFPLKLLQDTSTVLECHLVSVLPKNERNKCSLVENIANQFDFVSFLIFLDRRRKFINK